MFNGIASAGLSICVFLVPQFDKEKSFLATIALCGAMLFAGTFPFIIVSLATEKLAISYATSILW